MGEEAGEAARKTAFKYLSSLTEDGYLLRCHENRLAVEKSGSFHGATYNVMIASPPFEYFLGEGHRKVGRRNLLDAAPVSEENLRAIEITLDALGRGAGARLVAAFEAGWQFPDDGLISFRKVEPTETEGLDAFVWLDSRDRIHYRLGGKETGAAEVAAWLAIQGREAVESLARIQSFLGWLTGTGGAPDAPIREQSGNIGGTPQKF